MRKLEMETEHLRVFLPSINEATAALEYFKTNHAHLEAMGPPGPPDFYTLGFWEKRLAKSIEEFDGDQSVRLFFERKEQRGTFIGSIHFSHIARGPFQACYLGYSIDREFQGKGMMFEAVKAAIGYMFDRKHIHRIMANHLPENERSARLLKRLGFRVDGSSPDYLYIQSAWRAHVLNSLTNAAWTPREEDQGLFC